jgi:hypothetical protein
VSVNWRDAFTEDELEAEREKNHEEAANNHKRNANGAASPEDDEAGWNELRPETPWPEPIGEAAYHGVTGDFVRSVREETEADPAALLVQFLVFVGNYIGRRAWFTVGATRHHCNLFALIAGLTAKARKGSGVDYVRLCVTSTRLGRPGLPVASLQGKG